MKQYYAVKEQHADAIVLFRLGDFYEMFGDDAKIAADILQITLTSRDKGKDDPMPMCGVPFFSVDAYIAKLIKAGYKVAICEQMEDPKHAKGIVQREVVRVITPGTHVPDHPKENSFIMAVLPAQGRCGVAVADLSTGQFSVFQTDKPIEDEIGRFEPREVLCPRSSEHAFSMQNALQGTYVTYRDDWLFEYNEAYKILLRYFKVTSLEGFGCEGMPLAISAAGALIGYLEETQKVLTFRKIKVLQESSFMFLDAATKRNLEITRSLKDESTEGSLLWVLDETLTPMGGRFLRTALIQPLIAVPEIKARQDAVAALVEDYELLEDLRTTLRKIQDIERIVSKILSKTAVPRDLVALKGSLQNLPKLRKSMLSASCAYIKQMAEDIADMQDLTDLIDFSILEPPAPTARDGEVIKKGYNKEVDELRAISVHGKEYIARMETDERKRTGIPSLKIGFNRVFGYFIEITKSNLHLVPEDYIRKQTLANCERFVTQDLKDYETRVLGAEDRLKALEFSLFLSILERIAKYAAQLHNAALAVARIDFIASLATVAKRYDYVKPLVDDSDVIEIIGGRHPVIERFLALKTFVSRDDRFIPNNTLMDCGSNRLLIITGPNMAGKSTYMRQVALIVLLAQIGSFVPAERASIGVVDRIFTRIGASDNISRGQSTFMVEMIETAVILNNATARSLILLDEVGRGTSTFDGISIAWAVADYLVNQVCARTLFATHYHELTDLAYNMEGIVNYNVVVKEWGEEVIFLRKIERGPADKSYGIQVAQLAGLPPKVIDTAKEILSKLEKKESQMLRPKARQMDLFFAGDPIARELLQLDIDTLSAQKALKKLKELKKMAEDGNT
jgi:DNA mismatch repair protein MutS